VSDPGETDRVGELLRCLAGEPTNAGSWSELYTLIYPELHRIAHAQMRRERADHTLQTTALVHEAYLKLRGRSGLPTEPAAFLAVAAHAMRQVLKNCARTHSAAKRGGGVKPLTLCDHDAAIGRGEPLDVIDLDEKLDELEQAHTPEYRVIEMRFFGGMTIDQIAAFLGLSEKTIDTRWRFGRAWLHSRLVGSHA
jgi:RNA polymerase sigma factor (TIGR02999 family)